MSRFDQQVRDFRRKYNARMRVIARTAVQDTISQAQRTMPEGGRMRIDTGFLRASIQAALGTMPRGPSTNDGGYGGKRKYALGQQVAGEPVPVTLLKWEPGKDVLYVGWTASYARPREYHDGFLRGAVAKWKTNVKVAAKKVGAGFA
jgi:hypothetical protein